MSYEINIFHKQSLGWTKFLVKIKRKSKPKTFHFISVKCASEKLQRMRTTVSERACTSLHLVIPTLMNKVICSRYFNIRSRRMTRKLYNEWKDDIKFHKMANDICHFINQSTNLCTDVNILVPRNSQGHPIRETVQ